MSEQPPSPWAADDAPPPIGRRKVVLLSIGGALLVLLVVAVVALDSVVGSLQAGPPAPVVADPGTDVLPDCADEYPDGFSDDAVEQLAAWYGDDLGSSMRPTGVPEGFPAAAFAWAGITPLCGSALVRSSGEPYAYLFYADAVSRTRFDALASMLTAAGAIMRDDAVPREPQGLEPGQLSGADATGLAHLAREFAVGDAGTIWLTLKTDDLLTTSAVGSLIIEYGPRT